ncbi:alpha/beta hydrolase family protein [Streptomyces lavendulocolor]|uniref:alpha/beta hydrolase family protein n=1 Tax=Streptomyces lavendulocolor TaxID=67316 RepID=UPI003C2BC678
MHAVGRFARERARTRSLGVQETTCFRALRAAQYYGQALLFVLGSDDPGSEEQLYKAGRGAWVCGLCDPAPVTANVPCRKTPLPVRFFRPDTSGERRPTVILTNGSDGQDVDMWTYGVSAALARGWNALVYDAPGQGQLLFVGQVVFTPRWETVVTPLVDRLVARPPGRDTDKIASTGLSMGGNLAPRAAAFESRIAALVAMPGCLSPWLGFPPELWKIVTPDKEKTNAIQGLASSGVVLREGPLPSLPSGRRSTGPRAGTGR